LSEKAIIKPSYQTPYIKMMLSTMQNALAGVPELQRKILLYCLETPGATAMRQIVEEVEEKRRAAPDRLKDYITAWRDSRVLGPPKKSQTAFERAKAYTFTTFIVGKELEVAKHLFMSEGSNAKLVAAKKDLKEASHVKFSCLISKLNAREKNGTPSAITLRRYLDRFRERGITFLETDTYWSMKTQDGVVRNAGGVQIVESECPPDVLSELTRAALTHKAIRSTSDYW